MYGEGQPALAISRDGRELAYAGRTRGTTLLFVRSLDETVLHSLAGTEGASQPFFSPAGFSMPPGFPKGNTNFTTNKVIVARAFAPASASYSNANLPFDPSQSEHATHVAGIAVGDHGTIASGGLVAISTRCWPPMRSMSSLGEPSAIRLPY